jgi:hypothetical protein
MRNIEVKVEGEKCTVTFNINDVGEKSSSGKSMTIASTEGAADVQGRKDGKVVKLNLSAYYKAQ